jgi:NADH-quinone oxidoreductase subunit G
MSMPKLTVNGKAIEVPEGTNLIEAAKAAGVEVPHYCYHPALSIAGQCRLCMVDIEKVPRPQIACNTQATEGMVVETETERVKDTRRSMMEFHLINHPLDCPVCDQAGECFLQIYYMKHGLYDPRMIDEKVHKPKAVPLGPHVILDAERCILCSRCVRYCDEVTHTGELGIFHRGDHSEIGLFPGKALENKYSGNVIDICPVGALTDRDFRFKVRVWYLDTAKSICNGCARGCNIEVHTNKHRSHHNEGRRVARLKPRFNADVNTWWICDAGRYGFGWVDDKSRLGQPLHRVGTQGTEVSWDRALQEVVTSLGRYRPEEIGFLASPQMSNEDLWVVKRLADQLGVKNLDFQVPPAVPGDEDDFLIRADKNPIPVAPCSPASRRARAASTRPACSARRARSGSSSSGSSITIWPHPPGPKPRCSPRSTAPRRSSSRARTPTTLRRGRTSSSPARPMSSARAPSPISRGASSASAPRSSPSASRGPTG